MSSPKVRVAVVAAARVALPVGFDLRDVTSRAAPNPAGHMVVYCDDGRLDRATVQADPDMAHVTWQVSSFAPDPNGASHFLRLVRDYLLENGVDVPGWGHGVVVHEDSRQLDADEDVRSLVLVQALDQFSMDLSKE